MPPPLSHEPSGSNSALGRAFSFWTAVAQAAISLGADWLLKPAKSPSWEFPGSSF